MKLNKYIFENGEELVNLTTKKRLPKDSSLEILEQNLFLEGQESKSIESALFEVLPTKFEIKIIPTWECNLRCSHCFVLHELVKKDDKNIDKEKFIYFLKSYLANYPSVRMGRFQFIGGEASLRAKFNCDLVASIKESCESAGVIAKFATTTNCFKIDRDVLEFFSLMNDITISLDGLKEFHDKQRKAIEGEDSPFEKTLENIKVMVSAGMRDAIRVQASVEDEFIQEKFVVPFYKMLLMAGVKFERILIGSIVPTNHKPEKGNKFLEASRSGVYPVPCCKYRLMQDFVVDSSNKIYCDYFDADNKNYIGELDYSIKEIEKAHIKSIKNNMEVLHDEKCKECPVVGICWGWCCNTNKTLRPSENCDAEGLLKRAKANAAVGNLVNFYKDHRKFDLTNGANLQLID